MSWKGSRGRGAARLSAGYGVGGIEAYGFFPRTPRAETVAVPARV
ncbi:MAG: hypothetical protein ACM3NF_08745 [Gemmatimonadota bacterium]